jgi:sterol desaturase/sphingolipid hydroxylase (fatty acid hydroxylase superfamily)
MQLRFLFKFLHKLHHRTQVDPALKRAYPGLPSYLLKRHSALLSMSLDGHGHG